MNKISHHAIKRSRITIMTTNDAIDISHYCLVSKTISREYSGLLPMFMIEKLNCVTYLSHGGQEANRDNKTKPYFEFYKLILQTLC